MKFRELPVRGAYLIDLEKRGDERGFFARMFCEREFAQMGLATHFVQMNDSLSAEVGTLRGMHYQLPPHAETKVVRCVRGAVYDAIVDLRVDSPTFGVSCGAELTAENRTMIYVPKGCGHGILTLMPDTEIMYLVDEFYAAAAERGVRWNDPKFGIQWPREPMILSEKDRNHPDFDPAIHLR